MTYPDTCTIGSVYTGRCRYQDESYGFAIQKSADVSVKGGGLLFLPKTVSGLVADLTVDATMGPASARERQVGRVAKVERVGGLSMAHVEWLDTAQVTTLGTISDLTVITNGAGSVALVFTPATGATSHQAKVGGVSSGAAVGATVGIIVLTGLAAGSKSFTVAATDGTTTTTSNAVVHVVT
jgi:hypothetical protein